MARTSAPAVSRLVRHAMDRSMARRRSCTLSRWGRSPLLDVEIKTGRTHQIRVHLSSRGYGVIGDPVYGGSGRIRDIKNVELKNALKKLDRQALHAAKLSFLHPETGQRVVFVAEIPDDLQELCRALRKYAAGVEPVQGVKKNWKDVLKGF